MSENQAGERSHQAPIEVRLRVPEGLHLGVYSDYLRVSHTEHSFVLDFAHLPPPADLEGQTGSLPPLAVEATVVARVVVPRDLLPRIIRAMQENWQRRESRGSEPLHPG